MSDVPPVTTDLGPLEADFVTLNADLARIAEVPIGLGTAAAAALSEIFASATVVGDETDGALGRAFQSAIVGVIKESSSTDMHGNMSFNVDQRTLATHGAPMIRDVVAVVQDQVQTYLDGISPSAAPVAAPPVADGPAEAPKRRLKLDLASMFAGFIKGVADQANKPPKKG